MLSGLLLLAVGLANAMPAPCVPTQDSTQHSITNCGEIEMLKKRVTGLEVAFASMMKNSEKRFSNLEKRYPKNGECDGFIIDGKCFTVVIIGAGGLNYYDAKRVCTYDGMSKLGNIYTKDHFNELRSLVLERKGETRLTFINVWTDMTRDIPGGNIRLSNGDVADYQGQGNLRNSFEWRTDEARRTNIYVSYWTDGLTHFSNPGGYGNVWPTFNWNAALCERPATW